VNQTAAPEICYQPVDVDHCQGPKVKPEPDFGADFAKAMKAQPDPGRFLAS